MKKNFTAVAAIILAAFWALCAGQAWAQANTLGVQVSGNFSATIPTGGGDLQVSFTCTGIPTCIGTYTMNVKEGGCSNAFSFNGTTKFTGLDLTHPGSLAGTIADSNFDDYVHHADGTCTYTVAGSTEIVTYTATWDGTRGTMVVRGLDGNGQPFDVPGTFKSTISATPVFPMTVTGSVTPTIANVAAQIQYRSQDVGTTGSVYVFALAPATILHGAATKAMHTGLVSRFLPLDDPVPCVLAQLNSSGQLVGVTASTMQAYLTGVLGAQGQAVNILNNLPTPNVAGATFFVGYGTSASTMINSGVNRDAVTVPGALTCAPQAPQTGWWWNPLEGGRGFSIEAQGNNLFFAAFHYDVSGRATWNVSPGPTSLGGSFFTSTLYDVTGGQTLGGPYTGAPHVSTLGPITLAFSDASHGTMIWPGGTVPIERQNLIPGGLASPPQTNQPESGWWWNPDENGRGFFIEWQKGYADIAGYMYDDAGKPVWYIAVYTTPNARAFTGSWWTYANGQSIGGAYKPATRTNDNFAPLTITFSGPDTALMTLPNGRTTNLVRQRF